jgi:hypothetical protein
MIFTYRCGPTPHLLFELRDFFQSLVLPITRRNPLIPKGLMAKVSPFNGLSGVLGQNCTLSTTKPAELAGLAVIAGQRTAGRRQIGPWVVDRGQPVASSRKPVANGQYPVASQSPVGGERAVLARLSNLYASVFARRS